MPEESLERIRELVATPSGEATIFNVMKMKDMGYDVESLPYSIRVLLENVARNSELVSGATEAAHRLARWPSTVGEELPFMPYRVLLQDYTGVPLIVDLAAMRDAANLAGVDPVRVNSRVPVDLVVDHSIQVDAWGDELAFAVNLEKEYERNSERYSLLKWAQSSFQNVRVFPPGKGICHQFNLEYLSKVITTAETASGELMAFPDTLVGTDSHTTMVNGVGVLGWGVGGIEAEAVMLGEPYYMPVPKVFGVKLEGRLHEGVTPTDLVLTVTETLRGKNVVGSFVEYFGEGYARLTAQDRATLGNMSPEYGATVGYCPVDGATLSYLTGTARDPSHVDLVRRYTTQTGIFVSGDEPRFTEVVKVDLDGVEPSVAGPRNPEERRPLRVLPTFARKLLDEHSATRTLSAAPGEISQQSSKIGVGSEQTSGMTTKPKGLIPSHGIADGAVVISAITSCTNTSNPTVMVGAGLLAKKAVELGLGVKPWVKPSLAPGSTVVTDYLKNSDLLRYLDALGFALVGYGCTTCIGNSGPLPKDVEEAVKKEGTYAVAVLSGNRNFDGRIHPLVKGAFLMSPMLVVAYALAGKIDFDFYGTPLGKESDGSPIYLRDLWPTLGEIKSEVERSLSPSLYSKRYADAMKGDTRWESLSSYSDSVYHWSEDSTYVRRPPWFEADDSADDAKVDISGARALALFEDKVTTDHISPAGTIAVDSPAGKYLIGKGVPMIQFSSYGARRGNHEVMVRGGFSNIRLRNLLAHGKEGGLTTHFPSGQLMTIYEAAIRYSAEHVPLIVIAGKQYGMGSSRDWAAKAPKLLGVKAVIAADFERIHRSNLVAMGVLPLQFTDRESASELGLTGEEVFFIKGIAGMTKPRQVLEVVARGKDGEKRFKVLCRVDNATELGYIEKGGVLPYVFGKLARKTT